MPVVKKSAVNRMAEMNGNGNGHEVVKSENVTISAPDIRTVAFKIIGTSPYVQNKMSEKIKNEMKAKQEAGTTAKRGKVRSPKDFKAAYEGALYQTKEGWYGIPATAIKAALVAACRLVDFKMTNAKQAIYVAQDGWDVDGIIPMIRITKGAPEAFEQALRLPTGGTDIRVRPKWKAGWEAIVKIKFDAGMFTVSDVTNLLMRAGLQVGIGEGRASSKMCVGLGWGEFTVEGNK